LHSGLKKADPLQAGLGYRVVLTPGGPFSNRIRVAYVLGHDDLATKNIAAFPGLMMAIAGFPDVTIKVIDAG